MRRKAADVHRSRKFVATSRRQVSRQRNATVLLGEAIGIDVDKREVKVADGGPIAYDTLIVATGAHHTYFGHDDWAQYAQGLKTIEDATDGAHCQFAHTSFVIDRRHRFERRTAG